MQEVSRKALPGDFLNSIFSVNWRERVICCFAVNVLYVCPCAGAVPGEAGAVVSEQTAGNSGEAAAVTARAPRACQSGAVRAVTAGRDGTGRAALPVAAPQRVPSCHDAWV